MLMRHLATGLHLYSCLWHVHAVQGKIVQTQCYLANEKERLVRSPEMSSTDDEKQETTREKTTEDSDDEVKDQLGSLDFTVGYDKERTTLIVSVIRAKDLPIKNANIGSSDPYVKLQLLPDKRQKVCMQINVAYK
jgi:C2 domain